MDWLSALTIHIFYNYRYRVWKILSFKCLIGIFYTNLNYQTSPRHRPHNASCPNQLDPQQTLTCTVMQNSICQLSADTPWFPPASQTKTSTSMVSPNSVVAHAGLTSKSQAWFLSSFFPPLLWVFAPCHCRTLTKSMGGEKTNNIQLIALLNENRIIELN